MELTLAPLRYFNWRWVPLWEGPIHSSGKLPPAKSKEVAEPPMLARTLVVLSAWLLCPLPCASLSCQFPSPPSLTLISAALFLTFLYLFALFSQAAESFLAFQGQLRLLKSTVGLREALDTGCGQEVCVVSASQQMFAELLYDSSEPCLGGT